MNYHPLDCKDCSLCENRTQVVPSIIVPNSKVMFIGEAPGAEEDKKGVPFVGDAGRVLEEALREAKINRESISISNICCCRPPENRPPQPKEIQACFPYLDKEIKESKPELLVLLGNTPLKQFLKGVGGITRVRGKWFDSEEYNCKILPTFHPAYILRNPQEKNKLVNDLKQVKNYLDGNVFNNEKSPVDYKVVHNLEQFNWVIDQLNTQDEWSFDTETTGLDFEKDEIFIFTFSWRENTAVLIDLRYHQQDEQEKQYVWNKLKEVFENDKKKIPHNGSFDIEFLLSKGIVVQNYYCDTILMDYCLDENSRHGLEVLSEKYTDMGPYDMPLQQYKLQNRIENYKDIPIEIMHPYALMDADCTFRSYKAMLPKIYEEKLDFVLFKIMMPIQKILIQSEYQGVSIDVPYLKETIIKYEKEIAEYLEKSLQAPQVKEYIKYKQDAIINKLKEKWQQSKTLTKRYPEFEDYLKIQSAEKISFEFNINSSTQLKELLIERMKLPILKKTPKDNASLDDEVLEEYAKKNKFCEYLAKYRSLSHLKSTFLDGILNRLEGDKVHTDYLLFSTVTGRPSSRDPNLNNIPRTGTAEGIKDIFCADKYPDGSSDWLIEVDQGQCFEGNTEVRTLQGNIKIKELVERFQKGENFDIYSYDKKEKRVVIKPMVDGRLTGKNQPLLRITLDNNQYIDSTFSHKFIKRGGEDILAKDLTPLTSLLPFYERKKKSSYGTVYREIHCPTHGWVNEHKLVATYVIKKSLKGKVVHHIDGNGCNNSPENLAVITQSDHFRIHAKEDWEKIKNGEKPPKNFPSLLLSECAKRGAIEWWQNASEEDKQWRIEKVKEGLSRSGANKGQKNGMYGKHHSQETKLKQSQAKLPYKDIYRRKFIGESNPAKKTEVKEKIKIAANNRFIHKENRYFVVINNVKKTIHELERLELPITPENWNNYRTKHTIKWGNLQNLIKEFPNIFSDILIPFNHRVLKTQEIGKGDVYNITVKDCHTFALSAGVFVNNCEFRLWINYSKDPQALRDLAEGIDIHKLMAAAAYGGKVLPKGNISHAEFLEITKDVKKSERQDTKLIIFGIMYGRGAKSVAEQLGVSVQLAQRIINLFFDRYKVAKQWIKIMVALAKRDGYVTSIFGRKRRLLNINHPKDGIRAEAERQAINSPIQSAASDLTFLSCIEAFKVIRQHNLRSRLVLTVYDSLIFNIPNNELEFVSKLIYQKMMETTIPEIIVPLVPEIKIGKNWGSLMEVDLKEDWSSIQEKLNQKFLTQIKEV